MMVWRAATVIAHPFQGRVELGRDEDLIRNQYMNLTESWCAWERDRLVGFISLLATRIVALFVDPACQWGGIGGKLLARANEVHGPLSGEVFQENRIGLPFYEKHGFAFVREEPIPMGHGAKKRILTYSSYAVKRTKDFRLPVFEILRK